MKYKLIFLLILLVIILGCVQVNSETPTESSYIDFEYSEQEVENGTGEQTGYGYQVEDTPILM